jgi:hypothetical protein
LQNGGISDIEIDIFESKRKPLAINMTYDTPLYCNLPVRLRVPSGAVPYRVPYRL